MVPGLASAAKPPKPPGNVPSLTAKARPSPIVFGQSTVVSGKLSHTANNAGQTVQLQSDPFPYGVFDAGRTTLTATNGNYAFGSVRPDRNTQYRVHETTGALLTSNVVLVGVRLNVTFSVSDSTPRRGQRIHFSGRVRPRTAAGSSGSSARTARACFVPSPRRAPSTRRGRRTPNTASSCVSSRRRLPGACLGERRRPLLGRQQNALPQRSVTAARVIGCRRWLWLTCSGGSRRSPQPRPRRSVSRATRRRARRAGRRRSRRQRPRAGRCGTDRRSAAGRTRGR